jgi:hypothetical protein
VQVFYFVGKRSESEVGRSLSQGKVRNYPLCNVLREAKYLS